MKSITQPASGSSSSGGGLKPENRPSPDHSRPVPLGLGTRRSEPRLGTPAWAPLDHHHGAAIGGTRLRIADPGRVDDDRDVPMYGRCDARQHHSVDAGLLDACLRRFRVLDGDPPASLGKPDGSGQPCSRDPGSSAIQAEAVQGSYPDHVILPGAADAPEQSPRTDSTRI